MASYTIKKGDTLNAIAAQYGTTADALAAANGIADKNKIYAGNTLSIPDGTDEAETTAPAASYSYSSSAPQWQTSPDTDKARADYETTKANKPAEYQSQWTDQINSKLDEILNQGDFSYDAANDPLYQYYADRYQQQGKTAMKDTMANAASLTGGYGNSYAASAGQAAYNNYLSQMNDMIPTLYNMALNSWEANNSNRQNQLSNLQGMDETDYGRYRDTVGDYYTDLENALAWYQQSWNEDYAVNSDERDQYNKDREYALAQQKYNDSLAEASTGSGSGYGSSGSSRKTKDGGTTTVKTYNRSQALSEVAGKYDTPAKRINYLNKLYSQGSISQEDYIYLGNYFNGGYGDPYK